MKAYISEWARVTLQPERSSEEGTAARLPGMASEVENQEVLSSLKARKCFKNMIICAMCADGNMVDFTVSRPSCCSGIGMNAL